LNYLIPVWAVMLGALLFGERPATTDYLAMVIILGGIALSQRVPRDRLNGRREPAARQAGR
jgi:drug/metabolite transporter (DMT)-like permease